MADIGQERASVDSSGYPSPRPGQPFRNNGCTNEKFNSEVKLF